MKINNVIELDDKSIKFDGELSPEETQLVVELGLNFLARSGAFNVMGASASVINKDVH